MEIMLSNIFEIWNFSLSLPQEKIRKTSTQLSTKYKIKYSLYRAKGNSAIKHSLKYKEKVFSCVSIKTNCYMAQMEIYIFFPISVWENKYSVEYKI